MKRLTLLLILTILLSAYTPSIVAHGDDERLYIVVTLPVLADIVGNIAGDKAIVESLIEPGVNLAAYELTPKDSERIADSDLFLYVGYGNEAVLGTYAESIKNGEGVINILNLIKQDIKYPPQEKENPYFWMNPLNVKVLVNKMAALLSNIDPENSEQYMRNANDYLKQLDQLDSWIAERIRNIPEESRKLVTIRNTMAYYADRYGIKLIGFITGAAGTYEPQTKSVIDLFENIVEMDVGVLFVEYEESATTLREVIETLAEEAGVEVIGYLYIESLAPSHGVNTYIDLMRRNTEVIIKGLALNIGDKGSRNPGSGVFDNPVLRPFKYEFMRRGALTLLLVMAAAALVGSFAVLRGWAIFGDALSHGAIVGLVAAYLFSFDYFLGALLAGLVVALSVSSVERRTRLRTDVIIAVTFSTMLALAIAVLSYIGGATVSIEDILFADVTAVSTEMMTRTIISSLSIIVFAILFRRILLIYTVDPLGANALGMRTGVIHYVLLLLLAFTVVSSFMTIGAIPAFASLIIPPAASFLLSRRPGEFMVRSIVIALVSAISGIYISYYVGTNAGAAAILVSSSIFAGAVIYVSLFRGRGA